VTTVLPVSGRGQVAPFQVMRVLDAASRRRAAGLPTFDLSAGQPGTPAPVQVLEAARHALSDERLGYTAASGIPLLRQAIAGHYEARYDLAVDADDVVVTTGSSGGFLLAFLAAFDAGDDVVLARPGYPAYRNLLEVLGCRVVEIEAGPAESFTITTAMLDRLPRPPKGLVLASPANPTGTADRSADAGRRRGLVRPQRDPAGERRDLPRSGLPGQRGHRLADEPRPHRRQLVLEVLLDDGLAARLVARPTRVARSDRRAGLEPGSVPARAVSSTLRSARSRPTTNSTATLGTTGPTGTSWWPD